jgi:MFS family permease
MMLSAVFNGGVAIFAFYAMQPYLLELYGEKDNYTVAGAAAAVVAGAQIVGGFLVPHLGRIFKQRTSLLIAGTIVSVATLILIGLAGNFWVVLALLAVWAIVFAAVGPVRQAYVNGIVPSQQRATVLSADNLMNSAGGAISQPGLGKVAEVWGYPMSYLGTALFQSLAIPLLVLAKREHAKSDVIRGVAAETH